MKIHRIPATESPPDFETALRRASTVADGLIGENMLLSLYYRKRDLSNLQGRNLFSVRGTERKCSRNIWSWRLGNCSR